MTRTPHLAHPRTTSMRTSTMLWGLLITSALLVAACGSEPSLVDPEVCDASTVLARNPATGACEWASTCDLQWEPCTSSSECDNLDEATCMVAPGCAPEYGWLDGTFGPSEPPCVGYDCNTPDMPAPDIKVAESEWGFLGCFRAPSRCAALGEDACWNAQGCEAVYGAAPCFCDAWGPDQGMCACPDVESFIACTDVSTPQDCYAHSDELSCWDAGCEWDYQGGGVAPAPCYCPDGQPCDCFADPAYPIEPNMGACVPPTPQGCWDRYDEASCFQSPGCEWIYEGSGDCACLPGEVCDCRMAPGYCQPQWEPTCWDLYDPYTCTSDPSCQWTGDAGADPAPCFCDPNSDPACDCASTRPVLAGYCEPRRQSCYDRYDEYTCIENPRCSWLPEGGEVPICDCDSADPNCGCYGLWPEPWGTCVENTAPVCETLYDPYACDATPGCAWSGGGMMPLPPPCNCAPGDANCVCDPIDCWGSWLDEAGMCRAPNDGIYPDYCCAQQMGGVCQSVDQPDVCGLNGDEWTCMSAGCSWMVLPCECAGPDDPSCWDCQSGGVCMAP